MHRHWLFIGMAAMFFAAPRDAAGQSKQAVRPTTRTGVYTVKQAGRGAGVYTLFCKSCHTPETHTGATFAAHWNGKQLSELYSFVRDRMPKNDPNSLSEQEYADVVAYVLQMNKMPAGQSEMPADSTTLSAIRIVTSQSTSKREK